MRTERRPLILITNDDGFRAKGINELIDALKVLGDIVVIAPDSPRSGMSSAITTVIPIKYKLEWEEENITIYSCTGTPVDCVKLALNEILPCYPDIVVSGINHGGNMAICVNYSGTMGAAAEGCIFGIPSLGVSLLDFHPDADFSEACRLAQIVTAKVLEEGLPNGTYLNLNVPQYYPVEGVKVCHQAEGRWEQEYKRSEDAFGNPVFWLKGYFKNNDPYKENDFGLLNEGYATLVPCKIDVTDYEFMQHLKTWDL